MATLAPGLRHATIAADRIIYCRLCLMPSSRPRITFDEQGVCNACRYAEIKRQIDWNTRREEFLRLIEPFRSKRGEWDCVVPWSGGKDSSTIAYRLKFDFGLNPLLVTFSPLLPTDVGEHNRHALVNVGFDHIFFKPNQQVAEHLARRFFRERGNLKIAWDAGINAVPVKVALNFGIKLIFYAEHGETEYGGRVLHEESSKLRDFTEVIEHQIGDDPRNWVDDQVDLKDLNPYIYPDYEELRHSGVKALYFAYFFKWDMYENHRFIASKYDFRTCPQGRTDGTFTNFDSLDDKTDNVYYYLQFIKFGFGRAVRDASRMIQNTHLTRDDGLRLAQLYDAEFPRTYFAENLAYLGLTPEEFTEIVDKHRNLEIWKREAGTWKLRYPLL